MCMRVVIYVPAARGASRTRRAIEREMRRLGYQDEDILFTSSQAVALAALESGAADNVAGRAEAIAELLPRAIVVPPRSGGLTGLVVVPGIWMAAIWVAEQARRHPTRIATTVAAVASVVLGFALLAPPATREPFVADPPAAPEIAIPLPPPPPPAPPSEPAPEPARDSPPPTSPPVPDPPVVDPTEPSPQPTVPPDPPAEEPTPPPIEPPETPVPDSQCLLEVQLLGLVDIRLCDSHPSS